MDVRKLDYKDETFDLVIDKATTDDLACGPKAFQNIARMLKES